MTNNKRKGKRVEREAAKIMEDLTGLEWKRTVFSGAMTKHRDNHVYKGDIHCTDESSDYSEVVVEVKARKDSIKLQELFNPKSKWNTYLDQAVEQAKTHWLLLVKVNREGWFLVTPAVSAAHLSLKKPDDWNNRPSLMAGEGYQYFIERPK